MAALSVVVYGHGINATLTPGATKLTPPMRSVVTSTRHELVVLTRPPRAAAGARARSQQASAATVDERDYAARMESACFAAVELELDRATAGGPEAAWMPGTL